jgi:hypothetical protein
MHHKVIDDDTESYTVTRVQKMKSDHEAMTTKMPEAEAAEGAVLLLSVNQSGGVTAHTVHQTFNIHAPTVDTTPVLRPPPTRAGMLFFQPGEILGNVGFPGEHEYFFEGERALYLRLIPMGQHDQITQTRLQEVFRNRIPCPFSLTFGGTYSRNKHGAIVIDPVGQSRTIGALTQGTQGGELWGLNDRLFAPYPMNVFPGQPKQIVTVLPMLAIEKVYVRALENYVKVARSAFNLPFPYRIELGGFGFQDCRLGVPSGPNNSGRLEGQILEDAFRRSYDINDDSQDTLQDLLKKFFDGLYDFAACSRSAIWSDGLIAAHGLAPR